MQSTVAPSSDKTWKDIIGGAKGACFFIHGRAGEIIDYNETWGTLLEEKDTMHLKQISDI